jgi:hypothetical protein|tara:strand:- start:598 stop:978 length:381 start_codon:yes stop_codon:yes gene_type:complete
MGDVSTLIEDGDKVLLDGTRSILQERLIEKSMIDLTRRILTVYNAEIMKGGKGVLQKMIDEVAVGGLNEYFVDLTGKCQKAAGNDPHKVFECLIKSTAGNSPMDSAATELANRMMHRIKIGEVDIE